MHPEFPDGPNDDLSEWFAPLEAVVAQLPPGKPDDFFDVADFMVMCRIPRPRGGPLYEYKHRYIRLSSITVALDGLWLHELPWMKEGLEHERVGPSPFELRSGEGAW